MQLYFDTEFSQFRDGKLLSIGFVSDDDHTLYLEVDEPCRHRASSDFCIQHVLSQFGLVAGAKVTSDEQAGERVAQWLTSFDQDLVLCYDYKLDWRFLEEILRSAGAWNSLSPRLRAYDIASEASAETCLAAQESYFIGRKNPGRHHALVDAFALRERWWEYLRANAERRDA
jgi:hypothetical protein